MTATIHPIPWQRQPRADRYLDLQAANTRLSAKAFLARRFAEQTSEYALRNGDALLAQMAREFLEEVER